MPAAVAPSDSRRKSDEMPTSTMLAELDDFGRESPDPFAVGGIGDEHDDSLLEEVSEADESEASDAWPPKPPLLRFKMRVQFSERFTPSEGKALFTEVNADLAERLEETNNALKDMTVGWLNRVFALNVKTEFEFEIGFPIIILVMMDAIYAKRVRWREVDWRLQYKRALNKNHQVLSTIWAEVNMEKAREFRVENTALRLENMPTAPLREKLDFLRLMKHWFDQRIHNAGPYDPATKRAETVNQCKSWGHAVKFPPWVIYDKDTEVKPIHQAEFDKMPEYKRLIYFLGSAEHQTM